MGFKKKVSYDDKALEQAIKEVKAGQPVKTTALKFKIPRTTLLYKSRGELSPKIESRGPKCILGQENEQHLVDWIIYMKNNGFPVTKEQLLNSVRMLLNEMKKETTLPNNMPGRHWYNAFHHRHPDIRNWVAQNLTSSRATVSEEKIRAWFKECQAHLEPLGLLNIDASRKFNLDESAFRLNAKCQSVLASNGDKTVYNIVGNDKKECLTTLICGNAAGQLLPPMILFPYKRIPRSITSSMPEDWAIGYSDSGRMTSETFYEYITNVFYPWLVKNKIEFPVILYLDGHTSHLSYPLTKFCRNNKIEMIALYPNATHILQPMDVAMFHPLKMAWASEVRDWRMENNGDSLKRENFAPLLEKSLATLNVEEILQNGFKSTGLHPFSTEAINYKKYFESSEPRNTVVAEPMVDYHKTMENLVFIESNIDKNLLEQFKTQEESAEWNGSAENAGLFLFWQKIKKSITLQVQSGNNLAPVDSIDVPEDDLQVMDINY